MTPDEPCGIDRWEDFIRRAAQAIGAFVPEADVRKTFEDEGCPPRQAEMLVIAGRQLAKQQEEDFFKHGDQGAQEAKKKRSAGYTSSPIPDLVWATSPEGGMQSQGKRGLYRVHLAPEVGHYVVDLNGQRDYAAVYQSQKDAMHQVELQDWFRASEAAEGDSCPTGTCHPFSQLVKDPEKFAVCMARAKKIGELGTPESFYELVREDLETQSQETFVVVCVDFRGQLMDYVLIGRGQRHRVAVDIEDVLAPVLASRCDGFVCCHNHPTGIAEPSDADGELTESIKKGAAAACPATHLLDHLVIGSKQWYSFAKNNWKVDGKVQKS